MKVILTEDVVGLGDIGESVSVRAGYARNFLVPRGLAFEAESASAKEAQHKVRQIESKKRRLRGAAEEISKKMQSLNITLELRVGSNGRVFGSVGPRDIAQKLAEQGYEFDRRRVLISEPIKKIGAHPVRLRLHQDVETMITVTVNPIEASREEEASVVKAARESIEQRAAAKAEDAADAAE